MATTSTMRDDLAREVERQWPAAQAHWSRFLLLCDPIDQPRQTSIAQIDLATRQVSLNFRMILEKDLVGSVEALLAHEVGHHVCYPGSLTVQARMRLLERSVLPFEDFSLINLFTDLMINERLAGTLREQLVRIYRAFTGDPAFHALGLWRRDPSFLFYLMIYEELWQLEAGTLMGPAGAEFERACPSARAEAQVLAQNLFHLGPNLYTQFLYFASVLSRYLRPLMGDLPIRGDGCECGCGEPSAEDWAEALTPNAREQEAVRRAIEKGWFPPEQAGRLERAAEIEERIAGLPGFGSDDATRVPEVMAAWYRQQAEGYLFRPPPQRRMGEAIVPTTLEEWEPADAVREIDWLATLLQRGEHLGPAAPLRRTKIGEYEGHDVVLWQPRIEIYLDVSGSMPDPRRAVNAMTLAAQILTTAAIRAGGWVRALLYSCEPVLYWTWCRSEIEMSRFLMHYIGAGTEFPFDILARSLQECGTDQPIRVIISDSDFDDNYVADRRHALALADAVRLSPRLILLQHCPRRQSVAEYVSAGAMVIEVRQMDDFPRMAADLAFALFPDENDGALQT